LYWGAKCSIGRSEQKVLSETQSLSLAGVIEKLQDNFSEKELVKLNSIDLLQKNFADTEASGS
jgi:hypothetical protein